VPYTEAVDNALDITIECSTESNIFPARVLIGSMASRFSPSNIRPSVMQNKREQRINYISAVAAVAVKKINGEIGEDVKLYLALPPVEVADAKR